MKKILFVTFFAAFAGLVACSDDEDHAKSHGADLPPDCKAITNACHHLDVGEGAIHDCHEIGHAGDADECAAKKSECLETCVDADASTGGAQHGGESSSGHG